MIEYLTKPCLFCGDDACLREVYPRNFRDEDLNPEVFSARRVTEHYHYRMVRCANTGLLFSREILPDAILEKLYAGSKVTFSAYADIIRRDYWRPLREFSPSLSRDKALEIGCSSGFFLEELRARGFREVHGCEPSVEAREMAAPSVREGIHTGFFTDKVYPDASFDLICCFQTLDHLSDPIDMLRTCHAKLRPGGLLYAIVHNADGLQAKLFGEKSPIIDVEHIYLFNPRTLAMAVEKAGFRTLKAFPLKNSYPMEYWTTHAPIPFRKQVNAVFKALGLDKLRLGLSVGNMGIVARKA
ncbi:MAG TPA: class I SAM-dependent methyltransferase [Fibrobacteria bacterium]|nr:class I SAM-dependent methyltransferase [Fibrobacteria bacterium]